MAKRLKRFAAENPDAAIAAVLDLAVHLSTKAPLYALLVGLANVEAPEFAAALVARLSSELQAAALGGADGLRRARLLLRFAFALVVPGVAQPAAAVAAARALVDAAAAAAAAAPAGDDGRAWRPYADALVYAAVAALPFGGPELAEAAPEEVAALIAAAEAYAARRPAALRPGLRPFFGASAEGGDALAASDSGAASFLPGAVAAVAEMAANARWRLEAVPRVHLPLEATLATAERAHAVAAPHVPAAPPVALPRGAGPALAGALVLRAFPPRGVLALLEPQHTHGGRPAVERLVAEDYILDTVAAFEADRVEAAKRLAGGLPLPFEHAPLLCEVLFSQMLRLPAPAFRPVMYSTLMVDLCKLSKLFPRAMSACVRETFARVRALDPALAERLAEWLAYHLSSFEFVWPWARWAHVLEAPPHDAQRRFCAAVMSRLVRLSYWDRVQAAVPPEFQVLLPPKPEAEALPAAGDAAAAEADPEGAWAARALDLVRAKASPEEIEGWVVDKKAAAALGGDAGVLRMLARCLLVAGAKSYTHMVIALERYHGPLAALARGAGAEGEAALVETAARVWARSPQRAAMAVDRLMTLRLASAAAIVGWVFRSPGARALGDSLRSGMAWEVLGKALDKACVRVADAEEELAAGRAAAAAAERAAAAGGPAEAAAAARAALPEKEEYLAETTAQRDGALLQVLRGFADLLGEGGAAAAAAEGGAEGEEAADGGERAALREATLARLRSVLRRLNLEFAALEERIEAEVLATASEEVTAAVREQLRL
jgi:nuclear cap-binding protein subunit 1